MALAPSSDPRLFGIDLGQWLRQWQSAAALLLAHPALGALTPAVRVRLHQASGQRTLWSVKNGEAEPLPASAGAPQAEAIELPREEALERTLTLPASSPSRPWRATAARLWAMAASALIWR